MQKFTVILFYKYAKIEHPSQLMTDQKALAGGLNLRGRMIIAYEGINGTFEGEDKSVDKYIKQLCSDRRFADVQFKKSAGDGKSFSKLSIKVREEIVSGKLGVLNVDPIATTGNYITPKQLHKWFLTKKEFYIVDMRNDYEQEVGMFEGSIKSGMHWFWDLPKTVKKIEHLRGKTIVTVCTGGVRCEKASGFLIKNGFSNVYQLQGGIHSYMEQHPNENFKGALYVFDKRVVMHFGGKLRKQIVGHCMVCKKPSENYTNCLDNFCNRHFICCSDCLNEGLKCPMGCRDYSKEHPEIVYQHKV